MTEPTTAAITAEPGSSRTDFQLGVAVAIVAALVAVVDLANNRFGDDELEAVSNRASAYDWFRAKSVKEAVTSGERDTLQALLDSGALTDRERAARVVARFDTDAKRYESEKSAILEGGVVDGKAVVGARVFEQRAASLSRSGDILDGAELFLHLALLLGGVGVAVQHKGFERAVLKAVIALGVTGVVVSVIALALYATA